MNILAEKLRENLAMIRMKVPQRIPGKHIRLIGWLLRSRRNEKYSIKCSAPPPNPELTGECYGIQPDVLNGTA